MEGTQTEGQKRTRRAKAGRTGKDKQEQVIERGQVFDREQELVKLYHASTEASKDFSDAITVAAEKSGLNASAIRKYIIAKAGENFDKEKRQVTQLSLLFDVEPEADE